MPFVHLETEARATRWDEATRRWRIDTNRGEYEAQFVVLGPGPRLVGRTHYTEQPGVTRRGQPRRPVRTASS